MWKIILTLFVLSVAYTVGRRKQRMNADDPGDDGRKPQKGGGARPMSAPLDRTNRKVLPSRTCVLVTESTSFLKDAKITAMEYLEREAAAMTNNSNTKQLHTTNVVGVAVPTTMSTSRMPMNYTGTTDSTTSYNHPKPIRGSVNIQHSFYSQVESVAAETINEKGSKAHPEDTEVKQKASLANNVAERVALMQLRREVLSRRRQPGEPSSLFLSASATPDLRITNSKPNTAISPQFSDEAEGGVVHNIFQLGFDSRTTILNAARSACFNHSPSRSPLRAFVGVDGQNTINIRRHEGDAEAALLLRSKKTEMMLSNVPVVGAGVRALLLASDDDVSNIAGGVMTIAQILASDITAQHDAQNRHGGVSSPNRQRAAGNAEPWRVIYNGGGESKGSHEGHVSPWNFDDVVNGSAVRMRNRPHSAPLSRSTTTEKALSRHHQEELGHSCKRDYFSSDASNAVRPHALQRPSSATTLTRNMIDKHHVAATSATPVVVVSGSRPAVPEWLDPRGLIGVSVDPRYQPIINGGAREGFGLFGTSILHPSGSAAAGDPNAAAAGGNKQMSSSSTAAVEDTNNINHYTSFRSATALSAIRKARIASAISNSAVSAQKRRGVLRGGAGFLMFSGALDPNAGSPH